jgi:tRNA A-37 threonylcarbamoyl transferase component Bud32
MSDSKPGDEPGEARRGRQGLTPSETEHRTDEETLTDTGAANASGGSGPTRGADPGEADTVTDPGDERGDAADAETLTDRSGRGDLVAGEEASTMPDLATEETLTDPASAESQTGARVRPDDQPTVPATPAGKRTAVTAGSAQLPPPPSTRFKLGGLIGEGGMATVVEAEDTRLDRTVAVKAIKPELLREPDLCERFLEEAKIQAGLAHPGAVPVYDSGTLGEGKLFYAMERISGKTLRELLRERSPERFGDRHLLLHLVDIFERVCQTMAYAHSHRIIHRDLKPGNIMVDDYGAVFVMDWGLAKRIATDGGTSDSRTQVGVVMGTPGFMSPEQTRGLADASDCQTDVFALGVILYQVLTGKRAFEGSSNEAVAKEILFHDPDPPLKLNSTAGRELSAICMKALAKDPRRRYATAGELAEDIRRFREFLPVSAIRPRLVDHVFNWVQRRKVLASALGTMLFVVLVAAAFLGFQAYTERQLVEGGFAQVDEMREEIVELNQELAEVRARIAATDDEAERTHLQELRLRELDARLTVKHWEMRGILMAIIGRTFFSPDRRALELAREQTLHLMEVLIEDGDYLRAEAFIVSNLERAEDNNVLRFGPEELQRVRDLLAEAEAGAAALASSEP